MGETSASVSVGDADEVHFRYSTVEGFFLQDQEATDPGTFDAMHANFGLIAQAYDTDATLPQHGQDLTQWQRFAHKLMSMNDEAASGTSFRLLYLARHGQGFHNVGESFYKTPAWNCYYSLFDADPTCPGVVFFDAHLTKLGTKQAQDMASFWQRLIAEQNIPTPQTFYVSPLTRAIQTADLTWASIADRLPADRPYTLVAKELLREGYGGHTCDRRPTKSYLTSTFPHVVFPAEDDFSEEDQLWQPNLREPGLHLSTRVARLLDDVLSHDDSTYISLTSHSGTIGGTLRAIGHRAFSLPTGGAIPVLIRADQVPGKRPLHEGEGEEWEGNPECTEDPLQAGQPGFTDIEDYLRDIDRTV